MLEILTILGNNLMLIFFIVVERLCTESKGSVKIDKLASEIFTVGIGSIVVGLVLGFAACKIVKYFSSLNYNPQFENLFVLVWGFLIYGVCHLEAIDMSGDVALIVYAIIFQMYTVYNCSEFSSSKIFITINFLLESSEGIAYFAIGLSVHNYIMTPWVIVYGLGLVAILLLGRLMAFAFGYMIEKFDKEKNRDEVFLENLIAFFSGTIKGPLALVLIAKLTAHDKETKLINAIVFYAVLIMHIMNTFIHFFVTKAFIGKINEHKNYIAKRAIIISTMNKTKLPDGREELIVCKNEPIISKFMNHYLWSPMLIRDYHLREEKIEERKIKMEHEIETCMHGKEGHGHGGHDEQGGHEEHSHKEHPKPAKKLSRYFFVFVNKIGLI